MKKAFLICFCLCAVVLEVRAENQGYLTGGPAAQSTAAQSVADAAQNVQEKKTDRLPTLKETLHTGFSMAGIKKMDAWVQENLW